MATAPTDGPTDVRDTAPGGDDDDDFAVVPTLCQAPAGAALCIDEVQGANESTVQAFDGGFFDWIELRNVGSEPVARSRVQITAGGGVWATLAGPDIAPGEVVLLWASEEDLEGHLPFTVDRDGASLELQIDGVRSDYMDTPDLEEDHSYGRFGGSLSTTCAPSPGQPNAAADPCDDLRDRVFEAGAVHEFHLTLDTEAWAILESSSTFVHPPAVGSLSFDGGTFPFVQVHLKGGYGSFRSDLDSQKTGFKIVLDEWEDQRWRTLDKITLNNMVQDPTFVHEALTYAVWREAGLPAPRVAYAHVHVNGVYFGAYSLIEPIDNDFQERWFGESGGHLLEAAYGVDFDTPGEELLFEYDDGPDEAAGRAEVLRIIELLDQPWDEKTYAELRTVLDMDQWMANMALEAASWHWDGYWTENNNRIYQHPTTGIWTILPHGTDQTWVDGWPNAFDASTQPTVYDFCRSVPSCNALYGQQVSRVADVIDAMPLEAMLDEYIAITDPLFAGDGARGEDRGSHDGELIATRDRILTVSQALRDAVAANPP